MRQAIITLRRRPARSLAVILLIIMLGAGAAWAILRSSGTLVGNTISTATADLLLSTDGSNFADVRPGFSFGGLVPGGQPAPQDGYGVWLKNLGDTDLVTRLSVNGPIGNPDNVELDKVHVLIGYGGQTQSYSLQALTDAGPSGLPVSNLPPLVAGSSARLSLQVSMDADAFDGITATVENIDLTFTGVAD